MSGGGISEGVVEQAALDWFRSLGYATLPGAVLAPGGTAPERSSYDQVVLTGRLREAALRINPDLPAGVAEQAVTRLLRAESQNALARTSASTS
jgi:type I restriction enzyme R subunit